MKLTDFLCFKKGKPVKKAIFMVIDYFQRYLATGNISLKIRSIFGVPAENMVVFSRFFSAKIWITFGGFQVWCRQNFSAIESKWDLFSTIFGPGATKSNWDLFLAARVQAAKNSTCLFSTVFSLAAKNKCFQGLRPTPIFHFFNQFRTQFTYRYNFWTQFTHTYNQHIFIIIRQWSSNTIIQILFP
jgi:hypothetical protein